MKKGLLTILLLAIVAIACANSFNVSNERINGRISQTTDSRTVIYSTGFEDGLGEWNTVDGTAPNEEWHLSTVGAFAGESWWMGDEEIGGYLSHRYIVLDTPQITVPGGNTNATFKLNYNAEAPAGATAPYDGWDGCNIRISTDNGANWNVISGTPAYNCDALYSFGSEFGEGENIAGWGGSSNGWVDASFSLAAYVGQSVKIRFAFCSDPGYDTTDDATLFGMKLDNINICGVLLSDGEGAAGDNQLIPAALGDIAGNHWVIDTTNPHQGVNDMHSPVEANLLNYLVSPEIAIPNTQGDIMLSYWAYYDLLDSDGNADNSLEDYYRVSAKSVDETAWTTLHWNYTGLQELPVEWREINQEFAELYFGWQVETGAGTCLLNQWAGQTVQIRFEIKTDDNNDGGTGEGLFIDDISINTNIFLPPVTTLQATANIGSVDLAWSAPIQYLDQEVAYYGDDWSSFISDGQPYAVRITNPENEEVALNGVNLIMYNTGGTVTGSVDVVIWEDNAGFPGDVLYTVEGVTGINQQSLTEVSVAAASIMLAPNQDIFVGIMNFETTNQGLLAENTNDQGRSFCNIEGEWMLISEAYNGLTNTGISATIGLPDPNSMIPNSYTVFRSTTSGGEFTEIGTSATTTYTDNTPSPNAMNYYVVTAIYDEGESAYSNEVVAYVLSASSHEYAYDDGSAETGYNVGNQHSVAVKYTPSIDPGIGECQLLMAKIYVQNPGTLPLIVRVWDDNGANGMPGAQPLYTTQVSVASIVPGWNYVSFPDLPFLHFENGSFYVGVLEANGSSSLGLDTSSNGHTYYDTAGWAVLTSGNVMIRTIIDTFTGTEDNTVSVNVLSARNFPNPFNPITNISLNMPVAGKATVTIYNLKGQAVKTLLDENIPAGLKNLTWDGTDQKNASVASGVYFYRVETKDSVINNKMLLMK